MKATLDELKTCRLSTKERTRLERITLTFTKINSYYFNDVNELILYEIGKIQRYAEVWNQEATTLIVRGHVGELQSALCELEILVRSELGKGFVFRTLSRIKDALLLFI